MKDAESENWRQKLSRAFHALASGFQGDQVEGGKCDLEYCSGGLFVLNSHPGFGNVEFSIRIEASGANISMFSFCRWFRNACFHNPFPLSEHIEYLKSRIQYWYSIFCFRPWKRAKYVDVAICRALDNGVDISEAKPITPLASLYFGVI